MKKYTYENVKKDFKNKGYELLTTENEYKNVNQKLKYICPIHGEQETTYAHIREGKGCIHCGRERSRQSSLHPDSYYKELTESKGFIFVNTYIDQQNGQRYIECICPNHENKGIQKIQPSNLKRNKGCKYCSGNVLKSHEQFVESVYKIYEDSIQILENYKNQKTKIKCKCNIHDETFTTFPNNLLKGYLGCSKCKAINYSYGKKKSHDVFFEQVKKINQHINLIEKYGGVSNKIKCFCEIHQKEFTKTPSALINNKTGCDECYKDMIRNRMGKTTEQFIEEVKLIHPEIEIIGEYINRNTPIKVKCKTHNFEYKIKPYNLLKNLHCCIKSKKYVNEVLISNLLDKWKIHYVPQKCFSDCKDIRSLSFDFYLDQYNVLLEYQGEQHYHPISFRNNDKSDAVNKFEYTKKHDEIKREYCITNNIGLIEIPYWENGNIENYLFNKFKEYGITYEIKNS